MAWSDQVDNYCERLDPTFWAEPLNALSNGGFLIAAFLAWRMAKDQPDRGPKLLVAVLIAIGIGSFLFHTFATGWAAAADVGPITAFIFVYVYLSITRTLGLPFWAGLLAVVAFFPYSITLGKAVASLFGPLNGSAGYVPVVVLVLVFSMLAWSKTPATGRGLLIGAALLALSLVFRTLDAGICASLPIGTHFIWHLLNALALWWMIRVLIRHLTGLSLASGGRRG